MLCSFIRKDQRFWSRLKLIVHLAEHVFCVTKNARLPCHNHFNSKMHFIYWWHAHFHQDPDFYWIAFVVGLNGIEWIILNVKDITLNVISVTSKLSLQISIKNLDGFKFTAFNIHKVMGVRNRPLKNGFSPKQTNRKKTRSSFVQQKKKCN